MIQNLAILAVAFVMLGPRMCVNTARKISASNYKRIHQSVTAMNQQEHNNNSRVPYDINRSRFWEKVSERGGGPSFTVMSYNVLAQDLLEQHPYLYRNHDKTFLKWDVRCRNLLQEMQYFAPDILCLQEVQNSHLGTYCSQLAKLGYVGLYKKRTGAQKDGCAIYYKHYLLNLIEYTTVEYRQPNIWILDRDNVGVIAKFSPKNSPEKMFVVATTHFLYNPKREDVRIAQSQLLLTEIERLAFHTNHYIPIIITGDLNSSPDSPVYKFFTKGRLKYEHLSPRSLLAGAPGPTIGKTFLPMCLQITDNCQHAALLKSRESRVCIPRAEELKLLQLAHSERNCEMKMDTFNMVDKNLFSTGTLGHHFDLKSVYQRGVTTHQDEWVAVDYIFFTDSPQLTLLERYKLPSTNDVSGLRIPNAGLGSDHLCLVAKFQLP